MIARRVQEQIRRRTFGRSSHRHFHPLLITIIASVLLGGVSGELIAGASDGDRVIVGNTGGTLSGVIVAGGRMIVIGGGNARSDLADLVGRSTVPWRYHIDLLIIPGWDDHQPIGALGVIERGGVAEIVIAGQPDDTPVWIAVQQAAANNGIPVTIVNGHDIVNVAPEVILDLWSGPPTTGATYEFAVVSLRYHESLLAFVDASKNGLQAMMTSGVSLDRSHVLVAMRPLIGVSPATSVLLQPRAGVASDVPTRFAPFTGEVRSGRQVTVRLNDHEMRLPLAAVTGYGAGTAAPSPSLANP